MIYAMSDLHGCYDLYLKMLEEIKFSSSDTLYLLGDYVDRGDRGFDIILDIANRKNVVPLIGNHDYYALSVLSEMMYDWENKSKPHVRNNYNIWMYNGGRVTYDQFWSFSEKKREHIISIMESFVSYADVTVGERRFTMVHGGIPKYDPSVSLDSYTVNELSCCREDYTKPKFNEPGRYLITGHTPTAIIDPSSRGRIFHKYDHIAIDCGAVFDISLGCICLDTMEEFYVS